METLIYNFTDYRKYIEAYYKAAGKSHGFKSRLAEALSCNSAYISQVFNSSASFSPEQAEELNELFQHTKQESRYFLLLVQYGRAGSHKLKNRIKEQIDETLEKRLNLKERTGIKNVLSEADQAKFYSHWYYAAVHLIVTIHKFQTTDEISKALKISITKIKSIIAFLLQIGLIQEEKGRYTTGTTKLFLGKDSDMISKHHTNWRIKAIESLQYEDEESNRDLHYSTLFTYNKKDEQKIRERLALAIDEVRALVKESAPEDELSCMNLDFFKV